MNYRILGNTGLKVSEIGLGGEWLERHSAEEVKAVVDVCRSYGVNIIAVRYTDGRIDVSPSPTREFNAGEIVSIVGDDSDIEKMTEKIK